MPLFDFACGECGNETEDLVRSDVRTLRCPDCGAEMDRLVSMPARTGARWGDSQGYFDRGLGTYVENSLHRERVMKEKGFVPVSDYPAGTVENYVHNQIEEKRKHERTVATFRDNLKKFGGDTTRAVTETFPAGA